MQCVEILPKEVGLEAGRMIASVGRIVERRQDRSCQLLAILGIDQGSKCAIAQGVPAAILASANHADAGSHRLEKDNAEPFARARHHEHIRKPEIVR